MFSKKIFIFVAVTLLVFGSAGLFAIPMFDETPNHTEQGNKPDLVKLPGREFPSQEPPSTIDSKDTSITQPAALTEPFKIYKLWHEPDIQKELFSFCIQKSQFSQKIDEIANQRNTLLQNLKERHAKNEILSQETPSTIEEWECLSVQEKTALEAKFPPHAFEDIKDLDILLPCLKKADHFQLATISAFSNARNKIMQGKSNKKQTEYQKLEEKLKQNKNFALEMPPQLENANRIIQRINTSISLILELSTDRKNWLSKSLTLTPEETGTKVYLDNAIARAEEAIEEFKKYIDITTNLTNKADQDIVLQDIALENYNKGWHLKCASLIHQVRALTQTYEALLENAPQIDSEKIRKNFTDLDVKIFQLTVKIRTEGAAGHEEEIRAELKSFEYLLRTAQAHALGTPESREQANHLLSASIHAHQASVFLSQIAAEPNPKIVQTLKECAKYALQKCEAYEQYTPESDQRIKNLEEANWRVSEVRKMLAKATATRNNGEEKKAQGMEKYTEYWWRTGKAFAEDTPESMSTIPKSQEAYQLIHELTHHHIEDHLQAAKMADENNNPAQAECHQKAVDYILDQIKNFDWNDDSREDRYKQTVQEAQKIADEMASRASNPDPPLSLRQSSVLPPWKRGL